MRKASGEEARERRHRETEFNKDMRHREAELNKNMRHIDDIIFQRY
jgi:hypothetical protein